METPIENKLTLQEMIRVLMQNQVEELYYMVDGISDNNIELLVTQISEHVESKYTLKEK